jgi:hypothetical protein
MSVPDEIPESVCREVCILQAFLREEERRRRRLLREIAAVHLWQHARDHSQLARWISKITVQRREAELIDVVQNLERLQVKFEGLLAQYPGCAALLSSHGMAEAISNAVPGILLQRPMTRPRK